MGLLFCGADSGMCFRPVLEITEVKDIHEIHPAGHCLRSSGREILSEETGMLRIGGHQIPVSLIMVRRHGDRELFAVWYSTPGCSCSSFLAFRRHWKPSEPWKIYQFSILTEGSVSEAVLHLESMIDSFSVP